MTSICDPFWKYFNRVGEYGDAFDDLDDGIVVDKGGSDERRWEAIFTSFTRSSAMAG